MKLLQAGAHEFVSAPAIRRAGPPVRKNFALIEALPLIRVHQCLSVVKNSVPSPFSCSD